MHTEQFIEVNEPNNQECTVLEHPIITLHFIFKEIVSNLEGLENNTTYLNFINDYKESLYLESNEAFENSSYKEAYTKKLISLREDIAKILFSHFISYPQQHNHIKDNVLITYQDWLSEENYVAFNDLLEPIHVEILSHYQHIPGYSEYIGKLFSLDKEDKYHHHLEFLLNKPINWDVLFTKHNPFLGNDLIDFFQKEKTFTKNPHIIHNINNFMTIWKYNKSFIEKDFEDSNCGKQAKI